MLCEVLARGREPKVRALIQLLAELFRPDLLYQIAHPGRPAVLPVAELPEDLRDAPRKLHRFLRPHEHVYIRRHPGAVREPAADAYVEADRAVIKTRGEESDVVDLRLGTVLQASRDAHLELPRQVRVLPVAGEVVVDGLGHGVGVYDLLVVEAGDRATEDVAGRVAAGLHGRHPDRFQPAPDLRYVLDA